MQMQPLSQSSPRARFRTRRRHSRNGNRPVTIRGFHRSRLSPNVADTAAQLLAAFNANAAVTSYVNATVATTLTAPPNPPSWWASLTSDLSNAQTNAMQWVNTLAPDFTSIPQGLVNYNTIFQQSVSTVQGYCNLLIQNGSNTSVESSLQSTLSSLASAMTSPSSNAAGFATAIDDFAGLLSSDSTSLGSDLTQALQSQGANQAQVTALQTQINQLNATIASNSQLLSSVTTTTTVYIQILGISLTYTTINYNANAGIIGLSDAIATAAAAQAAIQTAQSQITSAVTALSSLNQEIVALSVINTLVGNLVVLAGSAQQAVTAIAQAWAGLTGGLSDVIADLAQAQTDDQNAMWNNVLDDIGTAQSDWNALQSIASNIANVTFSISNTITTIP